MKVYIINRENYWTHHIITIDKVFATLNAAQNFIKVLGAEPIGSHIWSDGECYKYDIIEADYMEQ